MISRAMILSRNSTSVFKKNVNEIRRSRPSAQTPLSGSMLTSLGDDKIPVPYTGWVLQIKFPCHTCGRVGGFRLGWVLQTNSRAIPANVNIITNVLSRCDKRNRTSPSRAIIASIVRSIKQHMYVTSGLCIRTNVPSRIIIMLRPLPWARLAARIALGELQVPLDPTTSTLRLYTRPGIAH